MSFRAMFICRETSVIYLKMVEAIPQYGGYVAPEYFMAEDFWGKRVKFRYSGVRTKGVLYREID